MSYTLKFAFVTQLYEWNGIEICFKGEIINQVHVQIKLPKKHFLLHSKQGVLTNYFVIHILIRK